MAKSTLQSVPVSQGEIIDLEIKSMAYDNSAVARYKDFIVFVERGVPGDEVRAEITTLRPNYARAKIIEIKKSDPNHRIEAPCKLFKVCGGCQWQNLPYEKQLEQKDFLMKQFCARLNLEDGVLKNIIGISVNDIWHYRNKVQYPVRTVESTGRLKAGYFEWHSNDLVNIKYCPIQNEKFDQIVETIRELAPKYKITSKWLRHICVRIGVNTGETLLTLVARDGKLSRSQDFVSEVMTKHPELVGVCININTESTNVIYGSKTIVLKGKGYVFEKIKDIKYKISTTSFFQVNTLQAEKLLDVIYEMYRRGAINRVSTILDAYSGVGLISLFLAKHAKKIIGIEEIKQSIDDANSSAKENNIKNVSFLNGKVENKIQDVLEKEQPEIIILDPPRAGCNKRILESILDSDVKKIIYVSCNPSTLIRDLEILCRSMPMARSFIIKAIQPVDIFPHTYHIESVVLMDRCES